MCPENRPQMGTVRPAVFKKGAYDEAKTGEIVKEEITVAADEIRTTLIERVKEVAESINLEEAEIIVPVDVELVLRKLPVITGSCRRTWRNCWMSAVQ